jgi:tetratricopeptide (TPR) repeat protein
VKGQSAVPQNGTVPIEEWERWNDYGIGLLLKGQQGQLRQAEQAFRKVEELGRPDGPINLARVYIREGLVQTHAPEALARAEAFAGLRARQWSLLWFSGIVNQQNGNYEAAIEDFLELVRGGFEQARGRGFDFSRDYRLLNELARTFYLRSLQLPRNSVPRSEYLERAVTWFERVLELDPENLTAHWGLKQIFRMLRNPEKEALHGSLHAKYKPDDNARDRAIAIARKNDPAADHAAEAVVIYDLQRAGAFELSASAARGDQRR